MQELLFFLWQQPEAPQSPMGGWGNILFIVAAVVIIYFMMIRPQTQQRKKLNEFASTLKKGSRVVTSGGIHGTIAELRDKQVDVIIAPKTVITIQRESISMEMTNAAHASEESESK
jgi:preprotein translocase subunit YajC